MIVVDTVDTPCKAAKGAILHETPSSHIGLAVQHKKKLGVQRLLTPNRQMSLDSACSQWTFASGDEASVGGESTMHHEFLLYATSLHDKVFPSAANFLSSLYDPTLFFY